MPASNTALILGATGQTGRYLLRELLASPDYSRVCEAGRRVTAEADLPTGASSKLEQKVINYERLDEAGLKEGKWDVVFVAMGTTLRTAGSPESFEKIDREYVVNAAKAAKSDADQRLVYVSVVMADPKASSLYLRSKGLTEQALAEVGYKDTIIFRPSMLANVTRPEGRFVESIALGVTGALSWFSPRFQIAVDKLAKSLCTAGAQGTHGLPADARATQASWGGRNFTTIDNKGAVFLAH
ncbi:hypothetical protein BC834DRAFT_695605 [Gloeopeniophorella convolvens]|nr:hypothetical protein BC834DRAFT_695605 [Gloeopeniophorella convolvens]